MLGGKLQISPNMPKACKKLSCTLLWKGQKLNVATTSKMEQLNGSESDKPINFEIWGQEYDFRRELIVEKTIEN